MNVTFALAGLTLALYKIFLYNPNPTKKSLAGKLPHPGILAALNLSSE